MSPRQFNLADLFEVVVDTVPDRLALVGRRSDVSPTGSSTSGPTGSPTTCATGASTPAPTWGSWPTTAPNGPRR